MPQKQQRFITRWFSRRIDLGALFAGILFVCIWAFPPAQHVKSVLLENPSIHIQNTDFVLDAIPAYIRPDLMFRPSRYHFTPFEKGEDLAGTLPDYPYSTAVSFSVAEPEGMGELADLAVAIGRPDALVWIHPYLDIGHEDSHTNTVATSPFFVRTSKGLGQTSLNLDLPVWAEEWEQGEAWAFSFWIGFDQYANESMVFVEQSTGDIKRDLRLIRIVKRLHVWDDPSGMGRVWLSYQPR